MKSKPTLILGGPGCGKTTALLEIVDQAFARGTEPHRIAYVAFTRKAAQEARERMSEKFGVEDIPYFRTLHSLAFQRLSCSPDQILSQKRFAEYAKAEKLQFNPEILDEFGAVIGQPSTRDEKAVAAIALARIMRCDIEDLTLDYEVPYHYAYELWQEIEHFKEENGLLDYTDLLEKFIKNGDCPSLDLLIVDEAQDLSRLQWDMVERMSEHAQEIYYAGDDDQAIYEWAGADLPYFLCIDGERRVLPTSYRLREQVYEACKAIIERVDARYPKDWQPHSPGGSVEVTTDLESLELEAGTWFLLARDNNKVRSLVYYLREKGWPYRDASGSSTDNEYVRAVLSWEHLRKGGQVDGAAAMSLWSLIPHSGSVNLDPTTPYSLEDLRALGLEADGNWMEVLAIPATITRYIQAVKDRGESLIKEPRITVSTIHGVKGGEADNVLLCTDLSPRVHYEHICGKESEHRVWFTGASRAKERLYFLASRSTRYYNLNGVLA